MALVEAALKSKPLNLFDSMNETPMSNADYAEKLAGIINDHIKTAVVNPGIPVSTSGGGGATTGPGSLS
jgi:hypothetical protein